MRRKTRTLHEQREGCATRYVAYISNESVRLVSRIGADETFDTINGRPVSGAKISTHRTNVKRFVHRSIDKEQRTRRQPKLNATYGSAARSAKIRGHFS
jgi:hypothetical protein